MLKEFDAFVDFCFEHGGALRNHEQFGEMARKLRPQLEAAQQSAQRTNGGLCAICGRPEYNHSPKGHDFKPAISGLRKPFGGILLKEVSHEKKLFSGRD